MQKNHLLAALPQTRCVKSDDAAALDVCHVTHYTMPRDQDVR